ncbi:MAG: Hsp70 family protein, partial [Methylococcales bacterium]|nr:Hsp70 family protein [Methylococcales bacterium]
MKTKQSQFLVGIDLGTTHTVVAYAHVATAQNIQLFPIEQLVDVGQVAACPLLPSVRYHPAEGEIAANNLAFTANDNAVLGEAARGLGAKTKGRFVTSAKSWLSHPSVDPSAAILPWGASDDVLKVSPLEASASYLAHVRTVWLHQFPDAPLEQQDVVITVPASFDEGARSLTLEAAKIAGLQNIRLLEEPQAVCYDWLRCNAGQLKEKLADVHLLLVCDVGGGTTDLTLIKVEAGEKEPKLTRIGVGDHLMLGGDNLDLALAHTLESRLTNNEKRLSAAELSQLLEQCRQAKERLLVEDAPKSVKVTLLSSGSKLFGGTRSATLTRDEVKTIALDGFFPLSKLNELPDKKRNGVVEFGLPYAAEPAVSKHIAGFLKLHEHAAQDALQIDSMVPDALLLNGGVFRSQPITQRVIGLLSSWREKPPILLENQHPELAVAFGAVSYALARREKKLKIGGGAARSYFLLIDTNEA